MGMDGFGCLSACICLFSLPLVVSQHSIMYMSSLVIVSLEGTHLLILRGGQAPPPGNFVGQRPSIMVYNAAVPFALRTTLT